MTTNHSDQGFISNRGASDRLFPAHLLTSFNHHRMLGSNKPEDDFVTRVKTIPLKSWQTASQHRTSRGNLCPGCQYRRIGLRRSFFDRRRTIISRALLLYLSASEAVKVWCKILLNCPCGHVFFQELNFFGLLHKTSVPSYSSHFSYFTHAASDPVWGNLCPDLPDGRLAAELPPGHPHPSAYGPHNSSGPFWS